MAGIPAWLLRQQVTISPYLGDTGYGPAWGEPVTVRAYTVRETHTVLDAQGKEVISGSTVFVPPGTVAPALSRLALPDGTTTTVLVRMDRDGGGMPTPDHVELHVQ